MNEQVIFNQFVSYTEYTLVLHNSLELNHFDLPA